MTTLAPRPALGTRPIALVGAELGLGPDELEPYGRTKAKIPPLAFDRRRALPDGRLVCVTSITPTPAGEGKTTTAIGLADGLGRIGERAVLALREPSLGPVFGIKGGGTGGGRAQLHPMREINLHLTGDIHAVGAATNLLAAMLDAHLLHGNELGIDPHTITWRRCLDSNDRGLRHVVTGLGGPVNGTPRETGFDIAAASETMAILAIASDREDLRRRVGAITVARTVEGAPVTAEDLRAAGSMAALLRDAALPNLVQTLEGRPALVHAGPFANIAHGNSSLLATRLGLKLADWVVTESGFGSDLGFEKLIDIVCRAGGLRPSAVVLVATAASLRHHGDGSLAAGAANLRRHVGFVRSVGFEPVVAVNARPGDTRAELEEVRRLALLEGARAAVVTSAFEDGGDGAVELAAAVVEASVEPRAPHYLYDLRDGLEAKLDAVATRAYGAAGIELDPAARADLEQLEAAGLSGLPVCLAKTPLSLSHDPALRGAPAGFTLPVRGLRASTGAGWVVALCGAVQTMPGLGAAPAAWRIDVDDAGEIVGLR